MNDHSFPVGSVMFGQKIRKRSGLFFVLISFPESALLCPAERSLSISVEVSRKIRESHVRKKEGNIALGQSAREKSLSYGKTFLPHPILCESGKVVPRFLYWGCQSKECVTGHVLVAYV